MSKFLNVDEDSNNEEEQEELPQVKEEPVKAAKNKDKKKQKKQSDDDIDAILGTNKPEEMDEEARIKAEKKKEKKLRQAEKKTQQPEQQPQQQPQQAPKKGKETKKPNAVALKLLEQKRLKEEEMKRIQEEEERLQREEDERIRLEELEIQRQKEEAEKIRQEKQAKIIDLKNKGMYKTKKQLEEEKRQEQMRSQLGIQTNVTSHSNVVKKSKKPKPGQQQQQQQQVQTIQQTESVPEKDQQQQQQQQQQQPIQEEKVQKEATEEIKQVQPSQLPQEADEPAESWEQFLEVEETDAQRQLLEKKKQEVKKQSEQPENNAHKNKQNLLNMYQQVGELRSPICCILGHVDTGKTTLLDKIRNTNVQEGEAGGITQQIGATFFPAKKLKEELAKTSDFFPVDCTIPGLLIIDTPGHESFSNLRNRGSSLADLAILVIDLMHGLENQTLESLELLKMRKTPFIIALNKVDRCVEWKKKNMASSYQQLQGQTKNCKADYETKRQQVFTQLAEKGYNVALYWENQEPQTYISVVPTSGITGEGIPDILAVIVKYTSVYMKQRIKTKQQFTCTVLEKKVTEGHGTTIDCLLIDGILKKEDKIVVAGFNGPIVTKVKALLTPHPMKELRVKGEYIYHDQINASMGLKISAPHLDEAMAGSQLYLIQDAEDQEKAFTLIQNEMEDVKKYIILQNQGVGVSASTLGSLEALLQFLNSNNIPVSYVSVGPVSKDDVMKALKNVLIEEPTRRKKEFACMLVFDIKVLPDAQKFAEENQIKIFEANIIYHLFDKFMAYVQQIKEERKKKDAHDVVFPCILKPVRFINNKEPLILGVEVERGVLKTGTPICVYVANKFKIGVVETVELNNKAIKEARQVTGAVAIRFSGAGAAQAKAFTLEDRLCSIMTRRAIDVLKEHYREDLTLEDWGLVKDLKQFFQIP